MTAEMAQRGAALEKGATPIGTDPALIYTDRTLTHSDQTLIYSDQTLIWPENPVHAHFGENCMRLNSTANLTCPRSFPYSQISLKCSGFHYRMNRSR